VKNPRKYELDALRAFGFLFVVGQHFFGGFAWREGVDTVQSLILCLLYVIAKPAVPIFLALVGFNLFLYSKNNKPDFKDFYSKKFRRIIIPYIFWAVVVITLNGDYSKFNNIVGTLIAGDGDYHLWYMGTLIRIFIFFPLTWLIFNYIYARGKLTRIISFVLFVLTYWLITQNNGAIAATITNFIFDNPSKLQGKFISLSPIFWSLYLVIGIRIAYEYDNFVLFIQKRKWYLLSMYPFLLAYNYYDEFKGKMGIQESNIVHLLNIYLHTLLYISFMAESILVFYIASSYIVRKLPKVASILFHISKHSYVGYLIHTVVLGKVVMKILSYGMPYSLPLDLTIYVIIIFISITIPHLISYIPYSYLLTGYKRNLSTKI